MDGRRCIRLLTTTPAGQPSFLHSIRFANFTSSPIERFHQRFEGPCYVCRTLPYLLEQRGIFPSGYRFVPDYDVFF